VKRSLAVLLLIFGVATWFVLQHYEFERDGFDRFTLTRRTVEPLDHGSVSQVTNTSPLPGEVSTTAPPIHRAGNTIRIASFNIQVFGISKARKNHVMEILADIVRRFDVVAIQEVRAKDQNLLPEFVERINATGHNYEYVIGPRLGRSNSKEQYAFIFDAASIEVDRDAVYTVDDPDDLLHREPMVGWFRVRGPPENEAFTFKLINIHTDPDEKKQELDALDDVFQAVRNDGVNEDDVILLGDLNVDDRHLGQLGQLPGIAWMITNTPTNTRGNKLYDNIVYKPHSTTEFTGRAGVFDMMRAFNLTMDQALQVSDHQPIWAEFSIREGGATGPLATRPDGATKQ
jgi:deoxyribonuclease-1-like protein